MARSKRPHDLLGLGQIAMPEVLREEAPLPSEVVLDMGILAARRREALAGLRGMLLERPPGILPEDWRVFIASVAPPSGHLSRAPGSPEKVLSHIHAAMDCFPTKSPMMALKAFREAQQRPEVAALIADFRALELADLHEQRHIVRQSLLMTIARGTDAIVKLDPEQTSNEWARVSLAVIAANKTLMELDGLAVKASEPTTAVVETSSQGSLFDRVASIAADLKSRQAAEPASAGAA